VARWADAARKCLKGQDFLVVVRDGVVQAEGGRSGDEFLIVAGLPAHCPSEANRGLIADNLRRRLDDLERLIVNGIDWEREGRDMLVSRPELVEWYQADVVPLLPKGRRFPLTRMPIALLLLVGILCLLAFTMPRWFQGDIFEKVQRAISSSDKEAPRRVTDSLDVPVKALTEWAKALEIDTGKHPNPASLIDQILKTLEASLFFPEHDSGTNTAGEDESAQRKRLEDVLGTLYRAAQAAKVKDERLFRAEKHDLAELLEDDEFRRFVCDLVTQPGDQFRLVKKGTAKDLLKELIPQGTPSDVRRLREFLATATSLAECDPREVTDDGSPFRKVLMRGKWHENNVLLTMERLGSLAVPTQADADGVEAVFNGLVTFRHQGPFPGFRAWHELAIGDDPSLFSDVVPYRKGRDDQIDSIFARLLDQLDGLLASKPIPSTTP
jgi:hypothetical protein